jgi:hypothetical protein
VSEVVLCECCKINKARIKDYRGIDTGETYDIQKFLVCRLCFNLRDEDFFKLLEAENDEERRELIREIVDAWELRGYRDEKDPKLNEEIANWLNFLGETT